MNKLEALNVVMEKQEHGVTLPMALKISVGGKWHTVTIDREDKNIQKIVRVLVMMMLRNEIEETSRTVKAGQAALQNAKDADNGTLQDYKISVATGWRPEGPSGPHGSLGTPEGHTFESVVVRAHSERDARVMAFILKGNCPDDASPTYLLALADTWTEMGEVRFMG